MLGTMHFFKKTLDTGKTSHVLPVAVKAPIGKTSHALPVAIEALGKELHAVDLSSPLHSEISKLRQSIRSSSKSLIIGTVWMDSSFY